MVWFSGLGLKVLGLGFRVRPGDNIRANGTSQTWTRPGMPHDAGGILRGYPLLGGAICPNVVSRVVMQREKAKTDAARLSFRV